ncbi:MAG: fumarate hydratase, partial [Eubacterium sp.]|nr:fumarate hydratase [Eubacterium sp.]
MRVVNTSEITKNIKEMCIDVNLSLSSDVKNAILDAQEREESSLGKQILGQLEKNMEIASETNIPICQDTGMAVVFLKVGQDVHFEGDYIEDAINEGIRQGYT